MIELSRVGGTGSEGQNAAWVWVGSREFTKGSGVGEGLGGSNGKDRSATLSARRDKRCGTSNRGKSAIEELVGLPNRIKEHRSTQRMGADRKYTAMGLPRPTP